MENSWKFEWRNDIEWFDKSSNQEIAVVHFAYENQTSTQWHYSIATILIDVSDKKSSLRKTLEVKE